MSSQQEDCLSKEEVIPNLWKEFKHTKEYLDHGPFEAIAKSHAIVIRREEDGLERIINEIEKALSNRRTLYLDQLKSRDPSEWIREWLHMHQLLFSRVLKSRGSYRQHEVRFGSYGDEELHKVPHHNLIGQRLAELATHVQQLLKQKNASLDDQLFVMAKIHYEFIRIHPFPDGNGRIGRVIIDQLCLAHGLPMVMGGYPRSNTSQRKSYHEAILDCVHDIECKKLRIWIKGKLERNIEQLG